MLPGTSYKIVVQNKDQTEISFITKWRVGSARIPLNIDKRFVMLRHSPGFYSYVVLERLKGWPAFDIQEGRIVFKLDENRFHYMAMSDERRRVMPMPVDRTTGQVLDYPEAVLLTCPTNSHLKGEAGGVYKVDDKYFYSCENKDNKVHGWVSNDPSLGFWMITPSNEFRTGGPFKQDLTSHVGPTLLNMFISTHYAGEEIALKFQTEDYWKKVFGPVYVYLNSDISAKTNSSILWKEAKRKMHAEEASWPYNFPLSEDFLNHRQRGTLTGQLLVHDWGYQFWTQTHEHGNFLIKNVVPGIYGLFAFVPGYIGDYKHTSDIIITPGSNVVARNVVFKAPRKAPTLWEIGVPDRMATEFFIPDPSPKIKIHHYPKPVEKFVTNRNHSWENRLKCPVWYRQYGLWTRYKDYYPRKDLVYTIGKSDYTKDWFFAHVTRHMGGNKYAATAWHVLFDLKNVTGRANYTLQLALASATLAELQVCCRKLSKRRFLPRCAPKFGIFGLDSKVRFNHRKSAPHFTTGLIGKDNAIARHGIHGLYRLYSIDVPGSRLVEGRNRIILTQTRNQGPFRGVMYDYIRFEGPARKH
ncbi:hypothetical protein OROGR_019162 [Orobanche gracilis]